MCHFVITSQSKKTYDLQLFFLFKIVSIGKNSTDWQFFHVIHRQHMHSFTLILQRNNFTLAYFSLCRKNVMTFSFSFFFSQKDEVKHFEEYRSIVPLRLLLSKRHNPERYKLTEFLMDHNENRKMYEDVWKAQRYMWNFFQLQLKLMSDGRTNLKIFGEFIQYPKLFLKYLIKKLTFTYKQITNILSVCRPKS